MVRSCIHRSSQLLLDDESPRPVKGMQCPFVVGERVLTMIHLEHTDLLRELIKQWGRSAALITKRLPGNKRMPEKLVGKEAIITSQWLASAFESLSLFRKHNRIMVSHKLHPYR
jgi:hypothetical protein